MAQLIPLYLATLAAFLIIDLTWLGFVARKIYSRYLGHLMAARTNWAAAIVFYLIFVAGILYFATIPGLEAESLKTALLRGAIYGFITYATYDLTNLATLKGWPLPITLLDMAWGTVLSLTVSTISFFVGKGLI